MDGKLSLKVAWSREPFKFWWASTIFPERLLDSVVKFCMHVGCVKSQSMRMTNHLKKGCGQSHVIHFKFGRPMIIISRTAEARIAIFCRQVDSIKS